MAGQIAFGVDIGGSGIKAAPVDLSTGTLAADRVRVETPQPPTPESVAEAVAGVVAEFDWSGPIGCTFPAVIKRGVAHTAANVDESWVGTDVETLLCARLERPVAVGNDADLAGLAEIRYGAGRDRRGVIHMVTLGTGIGSALFVDGTLIPNTELGHIELDGADAETIAAERVREEDDLSWKKWAKRVDAYLHRLEDLLWPDLIIVGGGVSKRADKFLPLLTVRTEVVPAELRNDAGIVGAAVIAPSAPGATGAPGGR